MVMKTVDGTANTNHTNVQHGHTSRAPLRVQFHFLVEYFF